MSGPVNKSLDKYIQKKHKRKMKQSSVSSNNNTAFIHGPVNKSFNPFISNARPFINTNIDGVSIITCTNKFQFRDTIFDNFLKQSCKNKELIIILNNNQLDLEDWKHVATGYENVRVYQLDERISLGECLNFGVNVAYFNVIAKFDDDDYYSGNYLDEAIRAMSKRRADVVIKSSFYVYFTNSKHIGIARQNGANKYIPLTKTGYFIHGGAIVFKKEVGQHAPFKDISLGEDVEFGKDCLKNGFVIYSTSNKNYVYMRRDALDNHTYKAPERAFSHWVKFLGYTEHFKNYIE